MTGARAPGDADRLCTVTLPSTGEVYQPAALPANTRVLMDSYDYILLLPRAEGGVWQLDDNNEAGRRTEVANKYTLAIGHRSSWHFLNFSGVRTPTFLADRHGLSVDLV